LFDEREQGYDRKALLLSDVEQVFWVGTTKKTTTISFLQAEQNATDAVQIWVYVQRVENHDGTSYCTNVRGHDSEGMPPSRKNSQESLFTKVGIQPSCSWTMTMMTTPEQCVVSDDKQIRMDVDSDYRDMSTTATNPCI
jgi:hypothetical protein